MTAADTHRAIDAVWRIESPKLIAGLARIVCDVGLAEDLAQDALVAALQQWPASGLEAYHLLPSVRGDLLARLGRDDQARLEFERAASLTRNARERDLLLERAGSVRTSSRRVQPVKGSHDRLRYSLKRDQNPGYGVRRRRAAALAWSDSAL